MTTPYLVLIDNVDEVFTIEETRWVPSTFPLEPNISKFLLIHLL